MRGSVTAPWVLEVPLWAPGKWSCLRRRAADFLSDAGWVTDVWLIAGVWVPACCGNQCRSGAEKNLRIWASSLLWRTDNMSSVPLYGKAFEEWNGLCSRLQPRPELWEDSSSLLFWHSNNWGRPKFSLLFTGRGQLVDIAAPAQTPLARAEQQVKSPRGSGWCRAGHDLALSRGPTSALAPRKGSSATLHFIQTGLPNSWLGQNLGSPVAEWQAEPHHLGNLTTGGSAVSAGRATWPRTHQPALEEAAYAVKLVF